MELYFSGAGISQGGGRDFLGTKQSQEFGTNLKKKNQNSRKKDTKFKKKEQNSRKKVQNSRLSGAVAPLAPPCNRPWYLCLANLENGGDMIRIKC